MSPETARKVVVASAVIGAAAIVYQAKSSGTPTTTTYRRVWGLLLLVIGGSVLADFVPGIVGPYMVLVLLGFLLANRGGLGALFRSASTAAGTGAAAPKGSA